MQLQPVTLNHHRGTVAPKFYMHRFLHFTMKVFAVGEKSHGYDWSLADGPEARAARYPQT